MAPGSVTYTTEGGSVRNTESVLWQTRNLPDRSASVTSVVAAPRVAAVIAADTVTSVVQPLTPGGPPMVAPF